MGKSGSGKTSMRSIIFSNYIARDTARLGPTMEVEHAHIRFLGNLYLHMWDCGGQEKFSETYLEADRDQIFRGVHVLIYVFDVQSTNFESDYDFFQCCLRALFQYSREPKVFLLLHKMDLVPDEYKEQVFKTRYADMMKHAAEVVPGERLADAQFNAFPTTIWDESLYKAWAGIVQCLVPNAELMTKKLRQFAEIMDADEILIFERVTFLVIGQAQMIEHPDPQRLEKVSNIIKQFRLACSRLGTSVDSMHIRNSNFSAFVDAFTPNSIILVVHSDPNFPPATTIHNLRAAAQVFCHLEYNIFPKAEGEAKA